MLLKLRYSIVSLWSIQCMYNTVQLRHSSYPYSICNVYNLCTHTCTHSLTYIPARVRTHTHHTPTHTHTHQRTHTHTHMHAHTHTHTHTHTHVRAHTHTHRTSFRRCSVLGGPWECRWMSHWHSACRVIAPTPSCAPSARTSPLALRWWAFTSVSTLVHFCVFATFDYVIFLC